MLKRFIFLFAFALSFVSLSGCEALYDPQTYQVDKTIAQYQVDKRWFAISDKVQKPYYQAREDRIAEDYRKWREEYEEWHAKDPEHNYIDKMHAAIGDNIERTIYINGKNYRCHGLDPVICD